MPRARRAFLATARAWSSEQPWSCESRDPRLQMLCQTFALCVAYFPAEDCAQSNADQPSLTTTLAMQGVLLQCRYALKPDGLFLGAMLGGTTLQELRIACTIAQQEREGGVAPRVSPLAQVRGVDGY